jgi:hypothetical protein
MDTVLPAAVNTMLGRHPSAVAILGGMCTRVFRICCHSGSKQENRRTVLYSVKMLFSTVARGRGTAVESLPPEQARDRPH